MVKEVKDSELIELLNFVKKQSEEQQILIKELKEKIDNAISRMNSIETKTDRMFATVRPMLEKVNKL